MSYFLSFLTIDLYKTRDINISWNFQFFLFMQLSKYVIYVVYCCMILAILIGYWVAIHYSTIITNGSHICTVECFLLSSQPHRLWHLASCIIQIPQHTASQHPFCESLTTFRKQLETFYFQSHSLAPPEPTTQHLRFDFWFLLLYEHAVSAEWCWELFSE